MLSAECRLRSAADFAAVVRGGRRAGTRCLVIHLLPTAQSGPARAGFVVSAKIGNSVTRHRVTRRLRPLVGAELGMLAPGVWLVIRALPAAAAATSQELRRDLKSGLAAAVRKSKSSSARSEPAAAASSGGA